MKKRTIILLGAAAVAAGALILSRALKQEPAAAETALPIVRVVKPRKGNIRLERELVGTVEPSDVVYLYPKAPGDVMEVYVKPGDMVQEGQVICQIDTQQVEMNRLAMETAKVAWEDAKTDLARQQSLYSSGDISGMEYEQAVSQEKTARLQYETAKLTYEQQMEYSHVAAPISGRVESCGVEPHDLVSNDTLLCVISGIGSKAVTFSVPERIVRQLRTGNEVKVEKSGSPYIGTITEISSMVDANTGLFQVKASVEQADALPTGSIVKLYVTSDRADNVLVIPVDAVYYSAGKPFVYLNQDNTVHQTQVELGIFDSEWVHIVSGVATDDQVITSWSSELFEGSQIQVSQ